MLKIIALTFIFYFKLANHLETLNKNIFKPKEMLKNSIIDLLYFIFSWQSWNETLNSTQKSNS